MNITMTLIFFCSFLSGMTPLAHAVTNQRLDLLKLLVKMGANINTQDSLGRTPVCLAAYEVIIVFFTQCEKVRKEKLCLLWAIHTKSD